MAGILKYKFGEFEADLRAAELRRRGLRLKMQMQPFQVLIALLERPHDVVTREELRQRLWPEDTFVDFDHGLNTAVAKLRETLGDSASTPKYVETIAKRGYRFLADVEKMEERAPVAQAESRGRKSPPYVFLVFFFAGSAFVFVRFGAGGVFSKCGSGSADFFG